MAVTIRLARTGRKNLARYRVVAADSRMPRDGRFLETLGVYNPESTPKEVTLKIERIAHWIKLGAKPSDTVRSFLAQQRFAEKLVAIEKGIDPTTVEAKPEPAQKKKTKKKKD